MKNHTIPHNLASTQSKSEDFMRMNNSILSNIKVTIQQGINRKAGTVETPSTLRQLINLWTDTNNRDIKKSDRKVIFATSNGERPCKDTIGKLWNGMIIVDMDIHDATIADDLQKVIAKILDHCEFLLSVVKSSSQQGLHVYTMVDPTQVYEEASKLDDPKQASQYVLQRRKNMYFEICSLLNTVISGYAKSHKIPKETFEKWIDFHMEQAAQGIFVSYDKGAWVNSNFVYEYSEFMEKPHLDDPVAQKQYQYVEFLQSKEDDDVVVTNRGDIVSKMPISEWRKLPIRYGYRWRLANTLVSIFGEEQGYAYLRAIVSNNTSSSELKGYCKTAAQHTKNPDSNTIKFLNKEYGFNIHFEGGNEKVETSDFQVALEHISSLNKKEKSKNLYVLHINENQYLGDIQDKILYSIDKCTAKNPKTKTLIEAGPGTGKTELIKQIANNKARKVVLILPYVSIIQSKIKEDENWSTVFGGHKGNFDVFGDKNIAITPDSFVAMGETVWELSKFDMIVVDESHLLFTSKYRSIIPQLVSQLDKLNKTVVFMTGTPSGETRFYKDLNHIKVIKGSNKKKEFTVHLCPEGTSQDHLCYSIAETIAQGKKVLFPTNNGKTYYTKVLSKVRTFLTQQFQCKEKLNSVYYKKANEGSEYMQVITEEKTTKDLNLIVCSSYLGCGVDIEDTGDYKIFFDKIHIANDCEQWCNRLRKSDLDAHLYVDEVDSDGNKVLSTYFNRFGTKLEPLSDTLYNMLEEIIPVVNKINEIKKVVDPAFLAFAKKTNYITFKDNKFTIDKTAFQISQFEDKYRQYGEQLVVMCSMMKDYGYTVSINENEKPLKLNDPNFASILGKAVEDDMKEYRAQEMQDTLDMIDDITKNESIYRDVYGGHLKIKQQSDKPFNEVTPPDLLNNVFYTRNSEVLTKVMPLYFSFAKHYKPTTIKELFYSCRSKSSGKFNFAALNRLSTLVKIETAQEENILADYVLKFAEDLYNFVEKNPLVYRDELEDFVDLEMCKCMKINELIKANDLYKASSGLLLMNTLRPTFMNITKALVNVSRPDAQRKCKLEWVVLDWQPDKYKMNEIPVLDFVMDIVKQQIALSKNNKTPKTEAHSETPSHTSKNGINVDLENLNPEVYTECVEFDK